MTSGRLIAIVGGLSLVLIAVLIAVAAGSSSDPARGSAVARAPAPSVSVQDLQPELGPLPQPATAAHVDLSKPPLLPGLHVTGPSAGLAFDFSDGRLLWRHNATLQRPIASLTKMMTGLLAVERLAPDDRVEITRAADQVGGSRMGGLRPGRLVPTETLLKGLLISSSNNAAVALAVGGAGSESAWVHIMNRRAKLLGLHCTKYVDPDGLNPGDESCPVDLAALAMRAMAQPRIARIARKPYARVWPGAGKKLTLRTTNHLLRDHYPGAIGLKTGFTNPAGFCLVAVVQRGSRRIGIVLLNDKDRWSNAMQITRAAVQAGILPRT